MSEISERGKPFYVSNKELFQAYLTWYEDIKQAEKEGRESPPIPHAIVDAMMKISTKLSFSDEFINYPFREEFAADALVDCVRFADKFDPTKILFKIVLKDIKGEISVKDELRGETSGYTGLVKYKSAKTGKISMMMLEDKDFLEGETVTCKTGSAVVAEIATHTADNPFSYITTIAYNAFRRRIDAEKKEMYVKAKLVSETPVHEFFEMIDGDDVDLQQSFNDFIRENSEFMSANEPQAVKRKKKKELEKLAEEESSSVNLTDFEGE